jgi:hypothetical protein
MKSYEVTTEDDGSVTLSLGGFSVTFRKDVTAEDVANGVTVLIESAVGVSSFELALAVIQELNKERIVVEPTTNG